MTSPATAWPALVSVLGLLAATSANAAPYVVEGFSLGGRVSGNSAYQSYTCQPSADFAGITRCQRTQQRGANATLNSTLMHTRDGVAVYVMANVAPVTLNKAVVQREIDELSREIKERPTVDWMPEIAGVPNSVIAVWGKVKLEELRQEAVAMVAAGRNPQLGVLVDTRGDLKRSAEEGLSIFRITGGPGYVYAASFDARGRGHRHYVAVDASQVAAPQAETALQAVLQKDQTLASNDYRLWPEVATILRRLALETSAKTANEVSDRTFDRFPSKKLRSRAWPLIPGGPIEHLPKREYWTVDVYGPNTQHPEIRRAIQALLAESPSVPFNDFLYYVIGEFDKALQVNPRSIISDVLHYASAHKTVELLLQDATKIVKSRTTQTIDEPTGVTETLAFLNQNSQLYDNKPLGTLVPNFAARAAAAKPHFEAVLRDTTSPHADDAAYMLGWLAFHQGKTSEALTYFSQAMSLGNGDYKEPAAIKQALRILMRFSSREQVTTVASNPIFAQQPALWYVAARSAYREHNYALTIEATEQALKRLNVPVERLPATTDPGMIDAAIEKANPQLRNDLNMSEIPYLLEASREILRYETSLKSVDTERPDNLAKRTRTIIIKYSRLLDKQEQQQPGRGRDSSQLDHRDLRQALHLIEMALDHAPKSDQHAPLREWLHYRKVRILVLYAPKTVPEATAAMGREYPKSQLMDDALAEQIYAQAVVLRDLNAAQATFKKLIDNYPTGNAIDNAHTWMAIAFRCEGRVADAQNMNRRIINLFSRTRHARYARERMAKTDACGL